MRLATLIVAALIALCAVVCDGGYVATTDELCYGVECSGHGECAVVDLGRDVTCICDPGYIRAGLECIPENPGDADADSDSDSDSDTDTDSDTDADGDEACVPECGTRACGDDGCGGECGEGCPEGWDCDEGTWTCACTPDCNGRDCGLDPRCGESCGPCHGACCDGTCHEGGTCCDDEDCGLCIGETRPCSETTDAFECDMRPGCFFSTTACAGTATDCDYVHDALSCSRQTGCHWSVCNSYHLCT